MYQRILLAYDGSESGQKALLDCRDIAQWSQSELYLIAVMPSPAVYIAVDGGFYDSGRDEEDKQRFKAVLEDGLRRLKDAGRAATGEMLVGDAVQEITEYAQKINADLIVGATPFIESRIQELRVEGIVERAAGAMPEYRDAEITRASLDAMEAAEGDQPLPLAVDLDVLRAAGLEDVAVAWLHHREAVTVGRKPA